MNNFPAMTEERRQELIAECEEEIAHLKEMMRGKFPIYSEEVYRSKVERQQIALAALTAEPVGVFYEASPGDWYQGSADGSQLYTKPLFTAPPAPVLKLPEYESSMDAACDTEIAHNVGWNACIDWIKRVNGVKS